MIDTEELGRWIQPQHLTPASIAAYRKCTTENGLANGFALDNFLLPHLIAKVQKFLIDEAEYHPNFRIYGKSYDAHVTREEWFAADESERMSWSRHLDGAKPEYRMSPNFLTFMKVAGLFKHAAFYRFLEAITGKKAECKLVLTHSRKREHILKKHGDFRQGKELNALFYFSPDWHDEYGGALCITDKKGNETKIAHCCNRMVLLEPTKQTDHYIEPITEAVGDGVRLCSVGWYVVD